MTTTEDFIKQAETIEPLSDDAPDTEFVRFYEHHSQQTADILSELRSADENMQGFTIRAGMMPPTHSVIDKDIQEFCHIPYRTVDGVIPACPGTLEDRKGCPPHAPPIEETIGLLSQARSFLIVQFEGREGYTKQGTIHSFIARVAQAMQDQGFNVLETYACGPCRVCPQGCGDDEECRQPDQRLFAPEACGFWVSTLCREASKFPVCGGGPREIRWIKDWRLATQDTDSVRYVTGVLVG